jgi:hypothetical protein
MGFRSGTRTAIAVLTGLLLVSTINYQSAVAVTGTVSGFVNENGTLTLTAPGGTVFTSVAFASYGTPNTASTPYTLGGCHASNSSTIVGSAFIGLNSASIGGDNNVFGDIGDQKTTKSAFVFTKQCNKTGEEFYVLLTNNLYHVNSLSASISTSSKDNITYSFVDTYCSNGDSNQCSVNKTRQGF